MVSPFLQALEEQAAFLAVAALEEWAARLDVAV
jgi:hypothetical protein